MILQVSPFLSDGSINAPAVALFILCLGLLVFGVASLAALWLHRRWPGLAGIYARNKKPQAGTALRQGVLVAIGVAVVTTLTVIQQLDIILVLVTVGLLGLLEAYVQNRRRP